MWPRTIKAMPPSLPGVATWLVGHEWKSCVHLPCCSPGGEGTGSFSCCLECSHVDKANTLGPAGDQAEELGAALECPSVLAEPGVTVHLTSSCTPFPGSETHLCSAFQPLCLSSGTDGAGGDAGVGNRSTGGLRRSESKTYHLD